MFTADFWRNRVPAWLAGIRQLLQSKLWALGLMPILMLPEWLFAQFNSGYTPYWDGRELFVVYLFVFFMLTAQHRRVAMAVAAVLFFLQMSALVFYSYFGSFYGPSDVMLFFTDTGEVFESASGVLSYLWLPVLMVLVAFITFYQAHRRLHARVWRSRFSSVMAVLLLIAPAISASLEDNSQHYEADSTSLAVKNALYSVSYYLGADLPRQLVGAEQARDYAPYQVSARPVAGKYHLVVVMGESLAATHMSLYGYGRETTPYLDSLRADPAFHYREAVSSGVSTRVSVPMFMNVAYQPDDWAHISSKRAALYRLAKQSGFQTGFVSTQKMDGISSFLSSADVDYWRDYRDINGCDGYDDCLIHMLDALPLAWDRPAFLVLNQRAAHSPYDRNYPASFRKFLNDADTDYRSHMINSYDDAVRYVDHNLEKVITHLRQRSRLPVLVVFTSDHGQRMGENGQFGHNALEYDAARVPFLAYGIGMPATVMASAAQLPARLTHYDISQWVAGLLGHKVINPNAVAGEYYLNGVDLMGRAGFFKYRLDQVPPLQPSPVLMAGR